LRVRPSCPILVEHGTGFGDRCDLAAIKLGHALVDKPTFLFCQVI
jgi:hypothetical protein